MLIVKPNNSTTKKTKLGIEMTIKPTPSHHHHIFTHHVMNGIARIYIQVVITQSYRRTLPCLDFHGTKLCNLRWCQPCNRVLYSLNTWVKACT